MVEVEKVCVSQGKLLLVMILVKAILAGCGIQEIRNMAKRQCMPTWERMIIVGMDPSFRTIWRATCVYNSSQFGINKHRI